MQDCGDLNTSEPTPNPQLLDNLKSKLGDKMKKEIGHEKIKLQTRLKILFRNLKTLVQLMFYNLKPNSRHNTQNILALASPQWKD